MRITNLLRLELCWASRSVAESAWAGATRQLQEGLSHLDRTIGIHYSTKFRHWRRTSRVLARCSHASSSCSGRKQPSRRRRGQKDARWRAVTPIIGFADARTRPLQTHRSVERYKDRGMAVEKLFPLRRSAVDDSTSHVPRRALRLAATCEVLVHLGKVAEDVGHIQAIRRTLAAVAATAAAPLRR